MGILGKISGNDNTYLKYKRMAEMALELLKEHAKNLDRNFEEIMNKTNTIDTQSIRLSSFLAGFVGGGDLASLSPKIGISKFTLIDRVVRDLMLENRYRRFKYMETINNIVEKAQQFDPKDYPDMSFVQGGIIISNLVKKGDNDNTRFNLTIFLDTLESQDGYYLEGENYINGKCGGDLFNLTNQSKSQITDQINIKKSPQNDNIDDAGLYLTATKEFEGKDRDEALWAKYMAINEGDEKKAKYSYINRRVEVLKKELINEISKQNHELKLKEQKRKNEAAHKELEKGKQKKLNLKQIRKQEYLKLLKPYPEDKSSSIEQELATENYFPKMINSNTRLILIKRFEENVNEIINNQ
mgnify:FL=1